MVDRDAAARAHGRAVQLLRERRFAEAWPLFEGRRWMPGTHTTPPIASYPEWTGQDLTGKHIMVVAEQGFGDQFMFGRWLGQLATIAGRVELLCHPSIWPVFGEAGYSGHPFFVNRPAPPADYWVLMGSLPLRLGVLEPPPPVYLPLVGTGGGGIGVKTSGSPTNSNDRHRTLWGKDADRLLTFGTDLDPSATGAQTFLDTARIIADLDLVVTVDTSVAHLAGAMGKACWVLLPYSGLDWRWNNGVTSAWYPDFRLFRQPTKGDWRSVLKRLERELPSVSAFASSATLSSVRDG